MPVADADIISDRGPASDELRANAINLLKQASKSSSPLLRANAIEGLQGVPEVVEPIARRALIDENRGVRFVAAMTIGRALLKQSAYLVEPLLKDESESVQIAAIYALKRCEMPVDLTPLGGYLSSESPEVRANAAMVLGELGNRSAGPMIHKAIGKGMARELPVRVQLVELQMAEALVKLGYEEELDAIRASLLLPADQGEVTVLACMICGDLNDSRSGPHLRQLAMLQGVYRRPAEIRLAASHALARIDPDNAPTGVPLEYATSENPWLRAQAAIVLGEIGGPAALPALVRLLEDGDPAVQVSAAAAILRFGGQ